MRVVTATAGNQVHTCTFEGRFSWRYVVFTWNACMQVMAQFAVPLHILLIDNGLYEVTGGQDVANVGKWATINRPAARWHV